MDPLTLALFGLGGLGSLFGFGSGRSAQSDATSAMMEAISKAMAEIQSGKKETMGFLEPYLKNAPQDYNRYRDMVQSGFFGQGAPTSFQAQDFTFDPSQGNASFQTNSFSPLPLPTMPQAAPQGNPLQSTPAPQSGPTLRPMNLSGSEIGQMYEPLRVREPFQGNPGSIAPQVGPNQFVGPPGDGMPKKMHDFLSMLGIIGPAFRGGGLNPNGIPGGAGPNIPLSPRPGGDFGPRQSFLPNSSRRRY